MLIIVGEIAVVVAIWVGIGWELFVIIDEEVLLVLVEISKGFWAIVCSVSEIWVNWLVGCIGESLVIVVI